LLDIVSLAKKGPGRRESWSREERELIHRTMRGSPEVMVKVLSQGAGTAKAVAKHMAYLSRRGELELETDDGQQVQGTAAEKDLLDDWEISSSGGRRYLDRRSVATGKSPRLVHKLMFSMPPGTPPDKVLEAVKALARNEFALKHRYAMVLHTDEPHPHVHVVVKALGEDGKRLNIKKPMLRRWRQEFARHLRDLGVDANATERGARGRSGRALPDSLYRLSDRGLSSAKKNRDRPVGRHISEGWVVVAAALRPGGPVAGAASIERILESTKKPQSLPAGAEIDRDQRRG
jgi:hypothetical protein